MAETNSANEEKKADVQDDPVRPSDSVSEGSNGASQRSHGNEEKQVASRESPAIKEDAKEEGSQAGVDRDVETKDTASRGPQSEGGSSVRHEKITQPMEEWGEFSGRDSIARDSRPGEDKFRRLATKRELRAEVEKPDGIYLKRALDKHGTLNRFVRWTGGQKKG